MFALAAVDGLPVALALVDGEERFRLVNREFARWYGITDEEPVGRKVEEVCPPETCHKFRRYMARMQRGERARFVGRATDPDGRMRHIRTDLIPVTDPDGLTRGCVWMIADITREKRARSALRRSRTGLANAQRIANIGSWEWNIASNELSWSDQIYRIFGLMPRQFGATYAAFLRAVHPDDRSFVEESVRRAVEEGADYSIDHRIVLPDGEVRVVHEDGKVTFGRSGRALRMTGVVRDVTAHRAMEDTLRHNREMLSGILGISPEAIIVTDQNLRIILFSSGAQQLFGYAADEILGQPIDRLIPDRFRATHARHVDQFAGAADASRRMSERSEIAGLRKNGEEFPAEASISRLRTPQGNVFAVILRDVGPRLAAMREMEMARLKAEAANESKSRFLANMSHELRTPLNAIIGFSQIIAADGLASVSAAKHREYAADILRSGQHLLSIINDILDISRIEAGKVDLSEDDVDVDRMLADCERLVQERAAAAGIVLERAPAVGVSHLRADSRLLKQILTNLLSNAIKFTPGGGRVELQAAPTGDGGFEFTVRDTGIGMSEDEIAAIGRPFVQVDNRLGRKYEGAGLGLSIAKGFAGLHGGRLDIVSAPGRGTTVAVRLPAARVARCK